jgi:hypothetical protein
MFFEPHHQPFLALVIFQIGSYVFIQGQPWTAYLLPMYPEYLTGMYHHDSLVYDMESC